MMRGMKVANHQSGNGNMDEDIDLMSDLTEQDREDLQRTLSESDNA